MTLPWSIGAELWRRADAEKHNAIGYNLANTGLDL
jgi:hypothetical protein